MTREEAIAILENEKKCVNRANKNDYCNRDCYNCELVKTDTEILTALDMAISALSENKGEWIPVSERLPEGGRFVIFCDIDDDIMVGYHVKGRPRTHFTQDFTFEDMKNVRAWQPLPEPYKAESEEL